jgi:hypothetical protein
MDATFAFLETSSFSQVLYFQLLILGLNPAIYFWRVNRSLKLSPNSLTPENYRLIHICSLYVLPLINPLRISRPRYSGSSQEGDNKSYAVDGSTTTLFFPQTQANFTRTLSNKSQSLRRPLGDANDEKMSAFFMIYRLNLESKPLGSSIKWGSFPTLDVLPLPCRELSSWILNERELIYWLSCWGLSKSPRRLLKNASDVSQLI